MTPYGAPFFSSLNSIPACPLLLLLLTSLTSRALTSANDELIAGFVLWEQAFRRNITEGLWQQNPEELVGVWELVDVAGQVEQGSARPEFLLASGVCRT
jgi:hypothetical protein